MPESYKEMSLVRNPERDLHSSGMPTTRDRVLDAALRAFASKGVDGTPITELEEAAGLAPGSGGFYRYYRTKEEALDAAVRREIERVTAARAATTPDTTDGRAWLTAEFERALDTLATLGPLVAILARERERIPVLAREIAEQLVEGGARHDQGLVASVRSGTTTATTTDDAAVGAVVISAVVGYHLAGEYFGAPPGGVTRADFVAALVDLVLPR